MTDRPRRISLCGPGEPTPVEADAAERIGELVARAGCVLVCGGLGGAMEAACRGAKRAGGLTIGILPRDEPERANQWVDVPICTGMGQARNLIVVATGEVVIAAGGGAGTLSEIALALRLGRPVVLHGGWASTLASPEAAARLASRPATIEIADSPEDAVARALRLMPAE